MADGFELCETCASEGRIYRANGNAPDPTDCGECPECHGDGRIEVKDQNDVDR